MKDLVVKALKQIEASAKTGIWEAHKGCSVVAGALLIEDSLIERDARSLVRALLERMLVAGPSFEGRGSEAQGGLGLGPFSTSLVAELRPHARSPREIGHDVIYSAYVVKALDRFGITPWESLRDQVILLIRKIKASGPGWITINGTNEVRELPERGTGTEADPWTIFSSFDRPRQMEAGDMQLGHVLTHGHAIWMSQAWAGQGLAGDFDIGLQRRLNGLRLANNDQRDKTPLRRRKVDPRTKEYWRLVEALGDMHGHAFKYAYSFLDLRRDGVSESDVESFSRIVWPDAPIR
jgi:hypothetical protein